jgi:tRNA pseudouridine55 synthase
MIYGFLNINKPKGITSFKALIDLRKVLQTTKIGHIGTLDPLATGVLVVAVGEALKLIEFTNNFDKEYEAEITLGKTSTTYDAEGVIIKTSDKKPTVKEIKECIEYFKGEILQIPPIFSAIKIKGKRAYELARKGTQVTLEPRKIIIKEIKIVSFKYPKIKLRIFCSKGTYIRSLAHDIGEKLNTGAYLSALKRTKVDNFSIKNSIDLNKLNNKNVNKYIIPVEKILKMFPNITLNDTEYKKLNFGQTILREDVKDGIDIFAGFFKNTFVGIIERVNGKQNNIFKYRKKFNIE